MKSIIFRKLFFSLLLLGLAPSTVHARDSVLTAIPSDSLSFVVVHNLADVNRTIGDLAKLVQAPAPDLLNLSKAMTSLQKGLDDNGDIALVVAQLDPSPKFVLLIPTTNYSDLLSSLKVKEPGPGIVAAQIGASQVVIGQKGNFAAIAHATDRDALERFLAATANVSADPQLAAWLEPNKISAVVTAPGAKALIPRAVAWLKMTQQQIQQSAMPNAAAAASGLQIYFDLLNAAQTEVDQLAIGIRVDSARNIDLVKRVQFTPNGKWATWAASMKPAGNLLEALPSAPFVAVAGLVYPPGSQDEMMNAFVRFMQASPMYNLTPEQAQKYGDVMKKFAHGARSAAFMFGAPQPGAPIFSNMFTFIRYDKLTSGFLDDYEQALVAMQQLAAELNNPLVPSATFQRVKVGDIDALEIVMKIPETQQSQQPGADFQKQIQESMFGPDREMKYYVAPADEHTLVIAYTSPDRLQAGIDFYKSKQPGLANEPQVTKVASLLPAGAQMVGLMNLKNVMNITRQVVAAIPAAQAAIPDFPDSPPIGMAAIATPSGVEAHLVITADTLQSIGNGIAQSRARAAAPPNPKP
jgi:hypothetical protein